MQNTLKNLKSISLPTFCLSIKKKLQTLPLQTCQINAKLTQVHKQNKLYLHQTRSPNAQTTMHKKLQNLSTPRFAFVCLTRTCKGLSFTSLQRDN